MTLASKLLAVLRNLLHKSRKDADEAAEIRAYIDLVADELVASGMPRAEAERTARVRCGGRTQLEQAVRDLRTGVQVVLLWQGVRLAIRQFLHEPLFTVAAVASLALGMGATTAIFSAVYSLTLRPLPYPDADRLSAISQGFRDGENNAIFAPDFMAMRMGKMHSFEQVAGFTERNDVNLSGSSDPERLRCAGITANFLTTLGVPPQLGRDFLDADDRAGVSPVVLISDRIWRSHFGGNSELIGRSITLDGEQRTVVGILPSGFVFPDASIEPDVFVPANLPTATEFSGGPVAPVNVIARTTESVTPTLVRAEVRTFFTARERLYPSGWARPDVLVEPLQEHVSGNIRRPLLLLLACIVSVLMVTCANVGNLQLARCASRRHEFSIRRALGASRSRLIQQFLIENLVLTFAASLVGMVLAWVSVALLRDGGFLTGRPIETAYGSPAFTGLFGKYGSAVHISAAVVLFAFAVPLLMTMIFGILPAVRATGPKSHPESQSGGRQMTAGFARRRFGQILLALEIAFSIALLSCTGLLIRSLENIMSYESGFDPGDTMTANVRLTGNRYQISADRNRFSNELLSRLQSIPGVEAAALTNVLPVENTARIQFSLTGERDQGFDPANFVAFVTVSPDYFKVVRTPVLQGRALDSDDTAASSRVMAVNRNLATRFFGGDAIGKQLYIHDLGTAGPHLVRATIVGVVENVPHNGFLQAVEPEVYLPIAQVPQSDFEIAIRFRGNPGMFASPVVKAVTDTDPMMPVTGLETMDERIGYRVMLRKAIMALISAFALLAITVSAIGVGGMFWYMVAQRTREMGIRLALGASRAHLLRIILKEASMILNVGSLLGLLGSFLCSRAIASMLVGIGEHDPLVSASALAIMAAVALSAALVPAIRACRADILAVLREE